MQATCFLQHNNPSQNQSQMGIHQKPLQTICKENSIDGSPIHQTHIANNSNNINKVQREMNSKNNSIMSPCPFLKY